MSADINGAARWRSRVIPALILVLFAAGALSRFNRLHLFDPDSPYYVMMARSLVELHGYSRTDDVSRSAFTYRPPGMSVLLMPAAVVSPNNALVAKLTVLGMALVMLGLVYVTARDSTAENKQLDWGALAVLAIVASSPYTLLFGTEVLSEVPFVAGVLAVLRAVTHQSTRPTVRRLLFVTILLAFLPFVRTTGIVMVAAIGLWSCLNRSRWIWLVPVSGAIVAAALWAARNASIGETTYSTAILGNASSSGLVALLVSMLLRATAYMGLIFELLLPGLTPGFPGYEMVTVDGTIIPAVPKLLIFLCGSGVCLAALYGLYARRSRDGGLAALYLAMYMAVLMVWPWTHERLAWPMIPVMWTFVPSGCRWLASRFKFRSLPAPIYRAAIASLVLALCSWQGYHDTRMIRANLAFVWNSERFYAEAEPGYYYADWNAAGRWLAQNSPVDSRVLTVHADVASTSHRPQEMFAFDSANISTLHRAIEDQSVDYLIVPSRRMPFAFPWELQGVDPKYAYEVAYEQRNVAILTVRPRSKDVGLDLTASQKWIEQGLSTSELAVRRWPDRVDLRSQYANALFASGKVHQAALEYQTLVDRRIAAADVYCGLGQCLQQVGRSAEALVWLNRAIWMPGAEIFHQQIGDGLRAAKKKLARAGEGPQKSRLSSNGRTNKPVTVPTASAPHEP